MIAIRDMSKWFGEFQVLKDITLSIPEGERLVICGPSGSGKSTLLQIAGLLEMPTSGAVDIAGQACNVLNDDARTAMRRNNLGFVYQHHHLLPEFSALENVAIPQIITGLNRDEARKAYAAKANARYREMSTKFPPARGLKDLQSVLQLIAKLDTVRMAQ